MMNVHGIRPSEASGMVEPAGGVLPSGPLNQAENAQDVVEISTAARLAAKVREIPDTRADLIARVRAEIEAGTYETEERIEVAIHRLMDELTSGS